MFLASIGVESVHRRGDNGFEHSVCGHPAVDGGACDVELSFKGFKAKKWVSYSASEALRITCQISNRSSPVVMRADISKKPNPAAPKIRLGNKGQAMV